MNTPPRKQIESGLYAPVWREFNKLIDYVREISLTGGRNVRLNRTLNGTTVVGVPESSSSAGTTLKQYRVKSIQPDYLICQEFGGDIDNISTDGANNVYVARDPELRRTYFDGKTISWSSDSDTFDASYAYSSNTKRVKTTSNGPETQVIVPYYKVDFTVITAAESSNETGVTDPNGNPIYIVEITQRAWAKLET